MEAQRPGQGSYCTVKILDTVRHIPTDSILYLEAVGIRHTLQMHLDDELLEFNSSLEHLAKQLGDGFWRCHRSFLVNRSRIRAVNLKEQTVEMDNGDSCLLSPGFAARQDPEFCTWRNVSDHWRKKRS